MLVGYAEALGGAKAAAMPHLSKPGYLRELVARSRLEFAVARDPRCRRAHATDSASKWSD
jgi:hypothetical protein